jgi:hypothetical protein
MVSPKNLSNWIHSERRTLFFLDDQYHLHNYGYTDTRTLVHYLLGPRVYYYCHLQCYMSH